MDLQTDTISSLPFPLEDEEIYEPPQDVEQGEFIYNHLLFHSNWLIQARGSRRNDRRGHFAGRLFSSSHTSNRSFVWLSETQVRLISSYCCI